jgi:flagellar motor switch protein FliN
VGLRVTPAMEVGRTTISKRDLLQPRAGSVIELGRETVAAFDVLVNGTVFAHGRTVVVKEKYGVRLTEVIRPAERIRQRGQLSDARRTDCDTHRIKKCGISAETGFHMVLFNSRA